jgi:hypothetical protein
MLARISSNLPDQAGLGTKNDCAGEDQQQFTRPGETRNQKWLCWRGSAAIYHTGRLSVSVYPRPPPPISPLSLLGNSSVNTFLLQRIHTQQQNSWTRCFLFGPCRNKYSAYSERKVGDYLKIHSLNCMNWCTTLYYYVIWFYQHSYVSRCQPVPCDWNNAHSYNNKYLLVGYISQQLTGHNLYDQSSTAGGNSFLQYKVNAIWFKDSFKWVLGTVPDREVAKLWSW